MVPKIVPEQVVGNRLSHPIRQHLSMQLKKNSKKAQDFIRLAKPKELLRKLKRAKEGISRTEALKRRAVSCLIECIDILDCLSVNKIRESKEERRILQELCDQSWPYSK